jgi:alpha-D-ribose 1-methylphosphonate 5-triphosphate synthase subunit PhnL
MTTLLETRNLTRTFSLDKQNDVTVLHDVSLAIERGSSSR